MIIITEDKNWDAKVVLEAVKGMLNECYSDKYDFKIRQKDFDNGREQGYALEIDYVNGQWLFMDSFHVVFARNRNSDSTVVYTGKETFYNEYIKEEFWSTAKLFDYKKHMKAAEYVVKTIIQKVDEIIKTQKEAVTCQQ